MERWFLAGAIVALIILLFDKPLAAEILNEVSPGVRGPSVSGNAPSEKVLPPSVTECANNDSPSRVTIAAPLSPPVVIQSPSTSTPARVYYEAIPQPQGSPAPTSTSRFFNNQPSGFFS